MFRRSVTLARHSFQPSRQAFLRNSVRAYSTEAAQVGAKRNWKAIALATAALVYFTPSAYAYFVLGYDADTLLAESAEYYRLLKFVQKERAAETDKHESSFDLIKKFYKQEKFSTFDLSSFPTFSARNKSLLRESLDKELFDELKIVKTSTGFGLDAVIKGGVYSHDPKIGVLAPDTESYKAFAPLFDKVITAYHTGYDLEKDQVAHDLNPAHLRGENPDPEGKYIVSSSISVSRNLDGYPFPAGHSRKDRQDVERKIVGAVQSLRGSFQGKYFPLSFLAEEDKQRLESEGLLFRNDSKYLESSGLYKDWPEGRGVFHSEDKTFIVQVNKEDEIEVTATQMGGNLKETFSRLAEGAVALENRLKFAHDEHKGYLTSCPSKLGSTLNATVEIKLPLASQQKDFQQIVEKNGLSVSPAEDNNAEGGVFVVSTKGSLGKTEVQTVQSLFDGAKSLIAWEKALEAKEQN